MHWWQSHVQIRIRQCVWKLFEWNFAVILFLLIIANAWSSSDFDIIDKNTPTSSPAVTGKNNNLTVCNTLRLWNKIWKIYTCGGCGKRSATFWIKLFDCHDTFVLFKLCESLIYGSVPALQADIVTASRLDTRLAGATVCFQPLQAWTRRTRT